VLLGEVEVTGEELDELIVVVRHHGLLLLLLLLLLRSWRFLGGFGDEVRGGCALTAKGNLVQVEPWECVEVLTVEAAD